MPEFVLLFGQMALFFWNGVVLAEKLFRRRSSLRKNSTRRENQHMFWRRGCILVVGARHEFAFFLWCSSIVAVTVSSRSPPISGGLRSVRSCSRALLSPEKMTSSDVSGRASLESTVVKRAFSWNNLMGFAVSTISLRVIVGLRIGEVHSKAL